MTAALLDLTGWPDAGGGARDPAAARRAASPSTRRGPTGWPGARRRSTAMSATSRARARAAAAAGAAGHGALVAGLCRAGGAGAGRGRAAVPGRGRGRAARPAPSPGCAAAGTCRAPHLAPVAGDFVAQAERFLGVPYLWGGRSAARHRLLGAGAARAARLGPGGAARFGHAGGAARRGAAGARRRCGAATWCSGRGTSGSCATRDTLLHANAHHMAVAAEPLRRRRRASRPPAAGRSPRAAGSDLALRTGESEALPRSGSSPGARERGGRGGSGRTADRVVIRARMPGGRVYRACQRQAGARICRRTNPRSECDWVAPDAGRWRYSTGCRRCSRPPRPIRRRSRGRRGPAARRRPRRPWRGRRRLGRRARDGETRAVGAQDLAAESRRRPPASSASPAIGVWHEPSSPRRNARSAASRSAGRRGRGSRASSAATAVVARALLDPDRALRDGRQHLLRARSAPRGTSASPSRRSPAMARKVAAATPSSSLRSRVCTLPRNSTTAQVGPPVQELRPPPQARGPDHRARRQAARASRAAGRDEGVARVLARQAGGDGRARRAAASACPSSNARRCRCAPASSASSISRVKRPLPPSSRSGRSCTRSPVVRIGDDREGRLRQAVRRHQPVAGLARLRQRQRAAAGADAERRSGAGRSRASGAGFPFRRRSVRSRPRRRKAGTGRWRARPGRCCARSRGETLRGAAGLDDAPGRPLPAGVPRRAGAGRRASSSSATRPSSPPR